MAPSDESLDNLADGYVQGLMSPTEAVVFEKRCEKEEDCRAALERARERLGALQAMPVAEASEELIHRTVETVQQHEQRYRRRSRAYFLSVGAAVAASVLVIAGFHLHYGRLSTTPTDLRVYGQSTLIPGTTASLRARVMSRVSNAPVAGAPVSIQLVSDKGEEIELASFVTDQHGSGQPKFEVPQWADGRYRLRIQATAYGSKEVIERSVTLKREARLMLSSDKPLYQPGQTIQVRALGLSRPSLKPIQEREAIFTIRDPKNNAIFKETKSLSRYGIASTSCPLATELIEGPYTISCEVGATESQLTVQVKKYVLPKFKITARLNKEWYLAGEPVKVSIDARYFFGKPVSRAKVHVVALEAVEGASRNEDASKPPVKRFFEETTQTDANGNVEVFFRLPKELWRSGPFEGAHRFELRVKVTDAAGQSHQIVQRPVVAEKPLEVTFLPEGKDLVPGLPNRIYLLATYPNGQPAKARIHFEGEEPGALQTNERGLVSFLWTPNRTEQRFRYEVEDGKGAHAKGEVTLAASGEQNFLFRTKKSVYRGGETLEVTFLGGGNQPVFVDVLRDHQTIHTSVVAMTQGKGEYVLDLSPEWQGVMQLCAYRFSHSGLPVRKSRIFYIQQSKLLQIATQLDRKEYRPGKEAKLNLKVTDKDGKPVPGAISLSAVDEAVFSVDASSGSLEEQFFLLNHELLRPVYTLYPWSPRWQDSVPEEERMPLEEALFTSTTQSAPDRWTGSPESASPHTLEISSYPEKLDEMNQTKRKGLRWVGRAWLYLGAGIILMGYLGVWLLGSYTVIFRAHLFGLFAVVGLIAALSTSKLASRSDATFDFVSSEVGGASGGENAAAPAQTVNGFLFDGSRSTVGKSSARPAPRLREWFPETLFWRPQVITDDQGRAQVTIPLADSITTWRLSSSAVSTDGRLGGSQEVIRVFQPFFVDLNLPVSLTRGDEVTIPVVVHNYSKEVQKVELTLEQISWLELLDKAEQTLEVAPGEVRSYGYRARIKKVGHHELKVVAQNGEIGDAISRKIEVVPDGRKIEQVVNGSLHQPATVKLDLPKEAIEGSAGAWIKIYPSTFSQLLEGMDAIFQMPYGCFEQTSSTTYPNVLALDYLLRTKQSSPMVEAKARQYIHLGYQRLLSFEVNGGGFDWYGRPPADVALTAYGLMEFRDMAKVHDIDPDLISRTRKWLLSRRVNNTFWPAREGRFGPGNQGDYALTAYVSWAVFGGGPQNGTEAEPTRRYLLKKAPDEIQSPYVLALTANALLAMSSTDSDAIPYLERLEKLHQRSKDKTHVSWGQGENQRTVFYGEGRSGDIEVTALAVLAFQKAKRNPGLVRDALNWLTAQKDGRGTWYSTQATILALKALLGGTGAPSDDQDRELEILLGDKIIRKLKVRADQSEVMQQIDISGYLRAGEQTLHVREKTKTESGYQVVFRYHVEEMPLEGNEDLDLKLGYDRTETKVGEAVQATMKVTNRTEHAVAMVMLDLPIPAGYRLDREPFERLVDNGTIDKYQITPRTVIVYVRELQPGKPLEIRYGLTPTMPVKVTARGGQAYAYYNPDMKGSSGATVLTAVER